MEQPQKSWLRMNPENLAALRNRLSRFSASYDSMSFHEIYDVKYNLQSSLLEYVNQGTLEELKKSLESLGSYFQLIYADHSGIIVYSTDGYEGFDYTSVTEKNFNKDSYQRSSVKAGQVIENGTNVYKTITDTKWSIIFPITETDAVAFSDSNTIRIRFVDTGIETTAGFSTFVGADEKPYGKLDLKDYMIQYYNSRYADIELFPDKPSGLKIPASSIVHKDFYVIPADYLTSGGDSNEEGFLREVYQKGENSTVFESPTIYYKTDEYCYVEKSAYSEGDNLIKPDSSEQYKIGPTETLTGVYNINKGYAVFNQVEILDSNEEYCIVAKGTKYGLSAFDHIVLKGNTISEDDIIY